MNPLASRVIAVLDSDHLGSVNFRQFAIALSSFLPDAKHADGEGGAEAAAAPVSRREQKLSCA